MWPAHLRNSLDEARVVSRDEDYDNILHVINHLVGYPDLLRQVHLQIGENGELILDWTEKFTSCDSFGGELCFAWVSPSSYKEKVKESEDVISAIDELEFGSCIEIEERLTRLSQIQI